MGPVFLHVDLTPLNLKNPTEFSALCYRESIDKLERLRKIAAQLSGELGCEVRERKNK